jgi:hypothetical protein
MHDLLAEVEKIAEAINWKHAACENVVCNESEDADGQLQDNAESEITISVETTLQAGNKAVAVGTFFSTSTVISSSRNTLSYESIGGGATTTLTFPVQYSFNGVNFSSYQRSDSTYARKVTKTSTLTQDFASEYTFNQFDPEFDGYSAIFLTTTKAIQIYTTRGLYTTDRYLSYFSTFTYKGIELSTTESSYVLCTYGIAGSYSSSFSESSGGSGVNASITTADFFYRGATASGAINTIAVSLYKSYYSLGIPSSSIYFYTQKSPNYKFVVGGTSNSIGGYRGSLSPANALTKVFFTTYKFERNGIFGAPIIAIPIDYTSIDVNDDDLYIYTYQSVSVPREFCLGFDSASVYWTKSTEELTGIQTESFVLSYAGNESALSLDYLADNDFDATANWSPLGSPILHTNGLVNTSSGADWSASGYYYWKSSQRTTSGANSDAVQPIGDGMPLTYIGSEWVQQIAFPVLTKTKTHRNSYAY